MFLITHTYHSIDLLTQLESGAVGGGIPFARPHLRQMTGAVDRVGLRPLDERLLAIEEEQL